jgi:transcriptional regulator GlxA family with amidase domain
LAATEKHYSVTEIASLWGLSDDTVRTLFRNHPGVLKIGTAENVRANRKAYVVLRVPESVLRQVHAARCKGEANA